MLYFKNNRWNVSTEKVRYTQHGEEIEQYVCVEGHDWWLDFEEKWDHTEILEFIPVELTEEQQIRFDEITQLNIKEGYSAELSNYVENGELPEGINHPLKSLQDAKRIEELERIIDILVGESNEQN